MKKVYLHCGLHKTGTTALQMFFRNNAAVLGANGVLFPRSGRIDSLGGGQHNIAWELFGTPEYNAKHGTINDLLEEMDQFEGITVISSEDLETVFETPGALADLVQKFTAQDYQVFVVVYLRNQVAYCESIYFQHIPQIATAYDSYTNQVLQSGSISKENAKFTFDFRKLTDIVSVSGAALILRNFHDLIGGSVISDFLEVISVDKHIFPESLDLRSNNRPKLPLLLTLFFRNNEKRVLNDIERQCSWLLFKVFGKGSIGTSNDTICRFRERFVGENVKVCEDYHISTKGLDFGAYTKPPALTYEELFASATVDIIRSMSKEFIPGNPSHNLKMARDHLNRLLVPA